MPAPRGFAIQVRVNMETMDATARSGPPAARSPLRAAVRPRRARRQLRLRRLPHQPALRLAARQADRPLAAGASPTAVRRSATARSASSGSRASRPTSPSCRPAARARGRRRPAGQTRASSRTTLAALIAARRRPGIRASRRGERRQRTRAAGAKVDAATRSPCSPTARSASPGAADETAEGVEAGQPDGAVPCRRRCTAPSSRGRRAGPTGARRSALL